MTNGPNPNARKLPAKQVALRYGVTGKTLARWTETGVFPLPMRVNGYRYWDLGDLEQFERSKMDKASSSAA